MTGADGVRNAAAAAAAALVGLATVHGCAPATSRSTGGAPDDADARRPVVDGARGFRMDWPGKGWRVLRGKEAHKLYPRARAVVANATGLLGGVRVRRTPSAPPDGAPAPPADDTPPDWTMVVSRFEDVDFLGETAKLAVFTANLDGLPLRFASVTVSHGGWTYEIVGMGSANTTNPDGSAFGPIFDAFSFLDDPPDGRPSAPVGADDVYGVGWRMNARRFESAVAGLRVEPPAGWRLAHDTSADLEVALVTDRPTVYARIECAHAVETDFEAYELDLEEAYTMRLGAEPSDDRLPLDVGARSFDFAVYEVEGGREDEASELLYAFERRGNRVLRISISYAAADRVRARSKIVEALASVTFLDKTAAKALADEFLERPPPEIAVGPTFSFEAGRFVDARHHLVWRKPRGFWRVNVHDEARADPAVALSAREPTLGLELLVTGEPVAESAAKYHARVAEELFASKAAGPAAPKAAPRVTTLAGATARTSDGTSWVAGRRVAFRLTTVVTTDRAYRILFGGTPETMSAAGAALDAALDGFAFTLEGVRKSPAELPAPDTI